MFCSRFTLILVLLTVPVGVQAQQPADAATLSGESAQSRKRLAELEQKLRAGKTTESIDELQRLLDEAGDDLVSVDGRRYRTVRELTQGLLARLPPEALKIYRDRVDSPARNLLERGRTNRDPHPLRLILARYSVSRPAEDALLLLGDLLFERGRFHEAAGYWRQLLPDSEPHYPDPRTPPEAVRARIILSEIFRNQLEPARRNLEDFAERHPKARGRLAGKTGAYADILRAILAAPPGLPPEPTADGEWPTFAGNNARTGAVNGRLPYYWSRRPSWKVTLPADTSDDLPARTSGHRPARHPVVLAGVAYVADAYRVDGFDLLTGERRGLFDLREQPFGAHLAEAETVPPAATPSPARSLESGPEAYTLSVADGALYARLGTPGVAAPTGEAGPRDRASSFLVSLAPSAEQPDSFNLRWKLPPPVAGAVWEGAPLVQNGRVYGIATRFSGNRVIYSLACYDDPPGQPLWLVPVCEAPTAARRSRHHLLTLANGRILFDPGIGVVAAVDADSGRPVWGFRYPRNPRLVSAGSPRDLCPPVAVDGRVFLAPADSDRIYALDLVSGALLWESGPLQVTQLLGVSRGRLIAALTGHPSGPLPGISGVRGFDTATGSYREPAGWAVHDDPFLHAHGRGLVSEELILWPTNSRDGTFLLNASDGSRRFPWLPGAQGNLAYADGVLLVATASELWGYVAPRRTVDPTHPRLRPLADAGRWPEAEQALAELEPVTMRRLRAEWLADRAERALLHGQTEAARSFLTRAAEPESPPELRTRAAARLLTLYPTEQPHPLPTVDPTGWLLDPSGKPVTLGEYADQLRGIPPPAAVPFLNHPAPDTPDILRATALAFDAAVAREVVFPSPRCVPLLPFAGEPGLPGLTRNGNDDAAHLLVTDGATLFAYRPGANRPNWSAPLPDALPVTHGIVRGDALIVAGSRSVVRYQLHNGQEVWRMAIPPTDPLPGPTPQPSPRCDERPLFPTLSGFTLAGHRLIARLGEHHLIAFDLTLGRVDWLIDPQKQFRFRPFIPEEARTFNPRIAGNAALLVVQAGPRRWTIHADTGRVLVDAPTTLPEWSTAPVWLGGHRVVVADEPGWVRAIQADTGHQVWPIEFPGSASLTGRPAAIRLLQNTVITAAFRNYAVEVTALDPLTGKPNWQPQSYLLPVADLDLTAADADDANLYLPGDQQLFAFRIETGRRLWSLNLSEAVPSAENWIVHAGRRAAIAYPAFPLRADPVSTVVGRILRRAARFPDAGRLPAILASVYDAGMHGTLPILFLDRETGKIRHRLDLAVGPLMAVHLAADRAVLVTTGRAYWLK